MIIKCTKCEAGMLERNEEWDKGFDRLDKNTPSHHEIYIKLRNQNIPLNTCNSCGHQEFA